MSRLKFALFCKLSVSIFTLYIKLFSYVLIIISITFNYSAAKDNPSLHTFNQISCDQDTSFSFIVWGHPRGAKDRDAPLLLKEFNDLVQKLKPDFIIITGDMIQGRLGRIEEQKAMLESDWDFFDKCASQLGVPIYRLPGNHDVSNTISRDIYSKRYPMPPYSFSYQCNRFILLDSIGIKQRSNDSQAYWGGFARPFDREQTDFIKAEISNQSKYNNLFFFMHHASPWSEGESFWWDNIHPLLVNSRTRAVFSGDNPSYMKFAHIEQDGIHYLLNNSFPAGDAEFYKRWSSGLDDLFRLFSTTRQMDNVQFVQVNGNEVKYKTHVFGELSKESYSWRFYDRIEKELSTWQIRLTSKLREKMFYRLRSIALVFTVLGGVCFVLGILFTLLLIKKSFFNSAAE